MQLCDHLKIGLVKTNTSPQGLAEVLDVDIETVEEWLTGAKVANKYLRRISDLLSIPEITPPKPEMDKDKLCGMVLHFCQTGEVKSKLSKLLFYADFKHHKTYGDAISHFNYMRWDFGPGPSGFSDCINFLKESQLLMTKRASYNGNKLNLLVATGNGTALFSEEEIKTMDYVKKTFLNRTATELMEFCSKEDGCKETYTGNAIPYRYSQFLQI